MLHVSHRGVRQHERARTGGWRTKAWCCGYRTAVSGRRPGHDRRGDSRLWLEPRDPPRCRCRGFGARCVDGLVAAPSCSPAARRTAWRAGRPVGGVHRGRLVLRGRSSRQTYRTEVRRKPARRYGWRRLSDRHGARRTAGASHRSARARCCRGAGAGCDKHCRWLCCADGDGSHLSRSDRPSNRDGTCRGHRCGAGGTSALVTRRCRERGR
jgi:hypothetical protein